MEYYLIGFFLLFTSVLCEPDFMNRKDNELLESKLERVTEINKDTVITKNLKLFNKKSKTAAAPKAQEESIPEWSYKPVPPEMLGDVTQFKKNLSACLKEVQNKGQQFVTQLSPKRASPVQHECVMACVLKRNEVLLGGTVNRENLLNLFKKFHGSESKMLKKLEFGVDYCIQAQPKTDNECLAADYLNDCTNNIFNDRKQKFSEKY